MAFQDGPAGANSVHLWDLKRGTRRRVGPSANDYVPSLSPDGTRIAFCSRESGTPQIHVMNADGSGRRAVTGRGRSVGVPANDDTFCLAVAPAALAPIPEVPRHSVGVGGAAFRAV
jgi:hypothetical protein